MLRARGIHHLRSTVWLRLREAYTAIRGEVDGVATQRALPLNLTARRSDLSFFSKVLSSFPLRPLRSLREALIFGGCRVL
jgi:hypothetical protein